MSSCCCLCCTCVPLVPFVLCTIVLPRPSGRPPPLQQRRAAALAVCQLRLSFGLSSVFVLFRFVLFRLFSLVVAVVVAVRALQPCNNCTYATPNRRRSIRFVQPPVPTRPIAVPTFAPLLHSLVIFSLL